MRQKRPSEESWPPLIPTSLRSAARIGRLRRAPAGIVARLAAVLGALTCLASTLQAQPVTPPNPRIGVFVGGSVIVDSTSSVIGETRLEAGFGDSATIGARLTVDVADGWSVDGGYRYAAHDLRLSSIDGVGATTRVFDFRLHSLDLAVLRYVVTDGGLRPFVSVGAGVTRFVPTATARRDAENPGFPNEPARIEPSTKPAFVIGGGLEARFGRVLGIRVAVGDNVSSTPQFGPAGADLVRGLAHDIHTSIGVMFHLP